MYCMECGVEITAEARFCQKCGAQVSQPHIAVESSVTRQNGIHDEQKPASQSDYRSASIISNSNSRVGETPNVAGQSSDIAKLNDTVSIGLAYLLLIFLGMFGVHRFYLARGGSGFAMLGLFIVGMITTIASSTDAAAATLSMLIWGTLLIWLLIDLFTIPSMVATNRQSSQMNSPEIEMEYAAFNGERSISTPAYQLYLTREFGIEKNSTLEKFVIDDAMFDTLDDALRFADNLETQAKVRGANGKLRRAYKITTVDVNGTAGSSGVKVGDYLVAYDGKAITKEEDIAEAISSLATPLATLAIIRNGKLFIFNVESGRLGIDGYIEQLDGDSYKTRIRYVS